MVPFRRGIPIPDPTASLGRGLGQGTRRTEAGGFAEYLPRIIANLLYDSGLRRKPVGMSEKSLIYLDDSHKE
jgi:hypothetical protein